MSDSISGDGPGYMEVEYGEGAGLAGVLQGLDHLIAVKQTEPQPSKDQVLAVKAAWQDPGNVPSFHYAWQQKLRKEWPTLAKALDEMTP